MFKKFISGFFVLLLIGSLYGCGSSGVKMHAYIDEQPRVDQEIQGNAGYLTGTPESGEMTPQKRTREVIVVEFSREPKEETGVEEESSPAPQASGYETPRREWREDPAERSQAAYPAGTMQEPDTSFIEYKVQKDDTLQKISKKFYDSYSKWPKIYEANRDKIEDPNRIKPGIVIQIPQE